MLLLWPLPAVGNPNVSIYSKHVQAAGMENQMGYFCGILMAVGGCARSIAPVFAGVALGYQKHYVAFSGPLAFWAMTLLSIGLNRGYLKDPSSGVTEREPGA